MNIRNSVEEMSTLDSLMMLRPEDAFWSRQQQGDTCQTRMSHLPTFVALNALYDDCYGGEGHWFENCELGACILQPAVGQ